MISVAILGGSGYTGKYLIKYCSQHPKVECIDIYANTSAGKSVNEIFPELSGEVNDQIINNMKELDYSHDCYFIALPHGESLKYVPELINKGKYVIDLGADFRLNESDVFSRTYQLDHPTPYLLNQKDYGLADLNEHYNYNLIANPGCYPTAALLSSLPFVEIFADQIQSVTTAAFSGLSGAGKKVTESLMFSENYNSVKAYNVGTHRHEIEIAQELNKFGEEIDYSLTTHLLPIFSGIYSTTIIHLSEDIKQNKIDEIIETKYADSDFVRIRKSPPELKWVIGSNYFDVNVKSVNKKLVVTSAIDNLIKGASGQAVQNMNILHGWASSTGIKNKKEEVQNA